MLLLFELDKQQLSYSTLLLKHFSAFKNVVLPFQNVVSAQGCIGIIFQPQKNWCQRMKEFVEGPALAILDLVTVLFCYETRKRLPAPSITNYIYISAFRAKGFF